MILLLIAKHCVLRWVRQVSLAGAIFAMLMTALVGCDAGVATTTKDSAIPDAVVESDGNTGAGDVGLDAALDAERDAGDPVDAELDAALDAERDAGDPVDAERDAGDPVDAERDAGDPVDANAAVDAADTSPPPQIQAFFNTPAPDGTPDTALEDLIIDLLEQSPPGSEVRLALYTFSRHRMARALADAYDRGVHVEIVLGNNNVHDNCVPWNAVQILKDRMNPALTICRECQDVGACIGSVINHNKFMTFSELSDGSKNVVLQSSANFTTPQIHQFNNLVIIRNDPTLYEGYRNYWQDLHAQQQNMNYYSSVIGETKTKAYFFPRERGDTIVNILNKFECSGGARVRLAMAFFTTTRLEIAQKMAAMQSEGCNVEVLLSDSVAAGVRQTLRDGGVSTRVYTNTNDVTVHSKYLLLDGKYYGTPRKLIFTGSHNYTGGGLRKNDETLLKINDRPTYDAFLANWETIRDRIDAL